MKKLFIADDEHWIIEGIKNSIDWEKEGYQFAGCADNGPEAVDELIRIQPFLALIDIRMPGFDGHEVISRVKPLCPDTHFIIISGYAEFDYALKGIELQVAGYILKPIEEEKLLSIIHSLNAQHDEIQSNSDQTGKAVAENDNSPGELIQYIQTHMHENISFHDLCKRFAKSPTSMRTMFSQELGMPFTQYLLNVRMQQAAKLLTTTDLLINEIAFSCGYEDVLYFRRVFKHHFGVTPSEYRNRE